MEIAKLTAKGKKIGGKDEKLCFPTNIGVQEKIFGKKQLPVTAVVSGGTAGTSLQPILQIFPPHLNFPGALWRQGVTTNYPGFQIAL